MYMNINFCLNTYLKRGIIMEYAIYAYLICGITMGEWNE